MTQIAYDIHGFNQRKSAKIRVISVPLIKKIKK